LIWDEDTQSEGDITALGRRTEHEARAIAKVRSKLLYKIYVTGVAKDAAVITKRGGGERVLK